jgi:hypothetical protein
MVTSRAAVVPPTVTMRWYEPGVMPGGNVATIEVALDEVIVRLTLLRVTVGAEKLLPVIVNVLVVRLATALSTTGAFAKADCEKDARAAMSRMVLKLWTFIDPPRFSS